MTYQEAKATLRTLKYICGLGENLREAIDVLTKDKDLDKDRWLEHEIVVDERHGRLGVAQGVNEGDRGKLSPRGLAATIGAQIKDAHWAAVDKDNTMYFYTKEPKGLGTTYTGSICYNDVRQRAYCAHCEVLDWTRAKWQLKELEE